MDAPGTVSPAGPDEPKPPERGHRVRFVFLAIAATWFLSLAFLRVQGDPATALVSLVQAFAFGVGLIALAFLDWRRFRWWWLVVALLVVAVVWVATGHPLLFLIGG